MSAAVSKMRGHMRTTRQSHLPADHAQFPSKCNSQGTTDGTPGRSSADCGMQPTVARLEDYGKLAQPFMCLTGMHADVELD